MSDSAILKDISREKFESYVQLAVLVAYADGDLSKAEEAVLLDRLSELADGRVPPDHLRELMVELPPLSRSSHGFRAERIRQLKSELGDPSLFASVFELGVLVARADDGIGLREGRMLINMAEELGLDSEQVKTILGGGYQ